ncbi:Fic family protein [Aquiflexum balticum]|uniref:Fic family protein n=1 Tax=Aquiflexum balticum TaxID=280473 RepID=UPI0018D3BB3F|nr:Fic family protein [Aquiflexum balticum]
MKRKFMATPSEKLAESLDILKDIHGTGTVAIKSSDLTRTHRERLIKAGFLKEIIRGWYITTRPDETTGESTSWFTSFWDFIAAYLQERFGDNWSLSPEQSVILHAGNLTVPRQLLVRSPQARNQITTLPYETSIFETRATIASSKEVEKNSHGLKLFSLASALVNCSEPFYRNNPTETRTALATFRDASEILQILLEGGHSVVAGRIAGAFRNIGRERIAHDILSGMRSAGYQVSENDPFQDPSPFSIPPRQISPFVNRMRLMWHSMREPIIKIFPSDPGQPKDIEHYLKLVSDNFVNDAYNSLSIEGYRVSEELIEKIRSGQWQPEQNDSDRQQRDALAAKGYWEAFQLVKKGVEAVLKEENSGTIADQQHQNWYRALFSPSVTAGIIKASDLAGYRNQPVYIRRSKHVPPNSDAVKDLMHEFFDLLTKEPNAAVRVVLGHFIFVYIHPYIDGNGRIARFLMNLFMASGGYPWLIIPLAKRNEYMSALEVASTQGNIGPFASFLAELIVEQDNKIN